MRKIVQTSALILLLGAPVFTWSQTGQALIANPLLSPAKVKEVKRQIVESAHRELASVAPVAPAAPVFVPPAPLAQPGFPNGMNLPQGPSPVEKARQALVRWQIIAIVGNTAILTPQPQQSARTSTMGQMAGQQWPMQQMPQMQGAGLPYGSVPQQPSQAPQEDQYARRSASVSVRHGERALIEGVEVTAAISGDSVQLLLGTLRGEVVYQGAIQPALYSPSNVLAAAAREKPSTEYANARKPDSTSLSGNGNGANAGATPQQGQSPYQSVQPNGVTLPLNGY